MTNDIIVWYCNIAFKIQQRAAANECNSDKLTRSLEEIYEEVRTHLRSENHTVNPKQPQRAEQAETSVQEAAYRLQCWILADCL